MLKLFKKRKKTEEEFRNALKEINERLTKLEDVYESLVSNVSTQKRQREYDLRKKWLNSYPDETGKKAD